MTSLEYDREFLAEQARLAEEEKQRREALPNSESEFAERREALKAEIEGLVEPFPQKSYEGGDIDNMKDIPHKETPVIGLIAANDTSAPLRLSESFGGQWSGSQTDPSFSTYRNGYTLELLTGIQGSDFRTLFLIGDKKMSAQGKILQPNPEGFKQLGIAEQLVSAIKEGLSIQVRRPHGSSR